MSILARLIAIVKRPWGETPEAPEGAVDDGNTPATDWPAWTDNWHWAEGG